MPLHMALDRNAAPEVVSSLLAAHPAGAAEKDAVNTLPMARIVQRFSVDQMSRFAVRVAKLGVARAWHEVVKVEAFAAAVKRIVVADPSLAYLADGDGTSAFKVAIGACRQAMVEATAFLGC
ncbi:hypothetical protein FOA52_012103 [Chlamydomonas sp. UWO 241]|nr:hypothetical protein FOA52_012103 [Chlamydomonas sp. UWO 241]